MLIDAQGQHLSERVAQRATASGDSKQRGGRTGSEHRQEATADNENEQGANNYKRVKCACSPIQQQQYAT